MFRNNQAFSSFSVDDIGKAKQFYGEVLGVETAPVEGMPDMLELRLHGGAKVTLYAKGAEHQAATFTVLNFIVESVEGTIIALRAAGVRFEIYKDGPVTTDDEGIAQGPGPKIAWFRDPAGNILSVLEPE